MRGLHHGLIHPKSIAVVGSGCEDRHKIGGAVLYNLLKNHFEGEVFTVNRKPPASPIEGVARSVASPEQLPHAVDLAVIALPAAHCYDAVKSFVSRGTKSFVIVSAGFGEEGPEGKVLERKIVDEVNRAGGSLIGPNCIGVMTPHHTSVFTQPTPVLASNGVDFVSASGALAVLTMEYALPKGIAFRSIFSVGNQAQTDVEEVVEHLDETYEEGKSSAVKMLYLENVKRPEKLLKHASSLWRKGCRIVAVKSGVSEAGSRAASSHTGAIAAPDVGIASLFKKAGIIRADNRMSLANIAGVLSHRPMDGTRVAIITTAGGPGVLMTDALSRLGMSVPNLKHHRSVDILKSQLYDASSVANPIDILATGTAKQVEAAIRWCDTCDEIDGIVVIMGSPGLVPTQDLHDKIFEMQQTSKKPVFACLPSPLNAKEEQENFVSKGGIIFQDEVALAEALGACYGSSAPRCSGPVAEVARNESVSSIRRTILDEMAFKRVTTMHLTPTHIRGILKAGGIPVVEEAVCKTLQEAQSFADRSGYPLAMKVVGPVHKTDVGGVVLNVQDRATLISTFQKLSRIENSEGVLIQPMVRNTLPLELFIGSMKAGHFGHVTTFGAGGVLLELLRDVTTCMNPLSKEEVLHSMNSLRCAPLLTRGFRRFPAVGNELADVVVALSRVINDFPEIAELDLNPLFYDAKIGLVSVDARMRVEKTA